MGAKEKREFLKTEAQFLIEEAKLAFTVAFPFVALSVTTAWYASQHSGPWAVIALLSTMFAVILAVYGSVRYTQYAQKHELLMSAMQPKKEKTAPRAQKRKPLSWKEYVGYGSLVVVLLFAFLTWPHPQLQVGLDSGKLDISGGSSSGILTSNLAVDVWNNGGEITNWRIVTPQTCLSAFTSGNVTCTTAAFGGGTVPCDRRPMCSKVPPGEVSQTQTFQLAYPAQNLPVSFNVTVNAVSYLGRVWFYSENKTYACQRNTSATALFDPYSCQEVLQ